MESTSFHGELKLFSGSSNPVLASKIASHLGIELGKILLKKFSNGETYAQFLEDVRGRDVFLVQTCSEPLNDNLMELLIMIDAAKRSSAGRITVVIPNYFYARQDRKAASREPITAKLVADLITVAGASRILTIDLHSDQVQGFFDIPFDNLLGLKVFLKKAKHILAGKEFVIVSPDAGSVKYATKISFLLGCDFAIVNKHRAAHNESKALHLIGGEVENKTCLVFDDLVDTAGTICSAADLLKEKGAKEVIVFATHAVLSGPAYERINSSKIDKLYLSDSVPLKEESEKIEIVSVAPYFAEAIKSVHENRSLSTLFSETKGVF